MGLLLDRLKQIELGMPPPALSASSSSNSLNSDQEQYNSNTDDDCDDSTTTQRRRRQDTTRHRRSNAKRRRRELAATDVKFRDISEFPTELSLRILRYLNPTDLCLAACVWSSLANDDILWHGLCKSEWGYVSIYDKIKNSGKRTRPNPNPNQNPTSTSSFNDDSSSPALVATKRSYRRIFMQLDEATLTFNADWRKGLDYLFKEDLLENNPMEIAKFINSTKKLNSEQKDKLFQENKAVLENVIFLHNYANQFLPTALRRFFSQIEAPRERNSYLSLLLEKFSKRFCSCNPQLGLNEDTVYILCFSLILLSVDLTSPAVKNKMSKREFIKNTRNALPDLSVDFTGHLYDNIYLNGSIAADLVTVR